MPEQSCRRSSTKGIALSPLPRNQGGSRLNPEEKFTINPIMKQCSESKEPNESQQHLLVVSLFFPVPLNCSIKWFSSWKCDYRSNFITTIPQGEGDRISGKSIFPSITCQAQINTIHTGKEESQVPSEGLTSTGKEFKCSFKMHYTWICPLLFRSWDMEKITIDVNYSFTELRSC